MDLDELVYARVLRFFRLRKKRQVAAEGILVNLESVRPRLTLIARAFSGAPLELVPALREGGYKGLKLFLPGQCGIFSSSEQNTAFYLFRTLYLVFQRQLGHNWPATIPVPAEDLILAQTKARESATEVLDALYQEVPSMQELHDAFLQHLWASAASASSQPDLSWLYGKWMHEDPPNVSSIPVLDALQHPARPIEANATTVKARAVETIQQLTIDKKQQEDFVMNHNFEKVETAEEFQGSWRDFDGSDEMDDHQDAMDELDFSFTVRTDDPTHSVYQADFLEHVSAPEVQVEEESESEHWYPEWDYSRKAYRPSHCRVVASRAVGSFPEYRKQVLQSNAVLLMQLRRMMARLHNDRERVRRQLDGAEFDLDALCERHTDLAAGVTPDDRVFNSSRKRKSNLSFMILLDASLSSDGYADGNRILDIEKQVAILFGTLLQEYEISFCVAAFHSRTRNHVSFQVLKDFSTPWSKARDTIPAIQPEGYTRIGGVLRHAATLFEGRQEQHRWIFLLSDGKPNDFDVYEGSYGIQDVRQAQRELQEKHIQLYALAIEAQARFYLPQMFGPTHFRVVPSMQELARNLVYLFDKIQRAGNR